MSPGESNEFRSRDQSLAPCRDLSPARSATRPVVPPMGWVKHAAIGAPSESWHCSRFLRPTTTWRWHRGHLQGWRQVGTAETVKPAQFAALTGRVVGMNTRDDEVSVKFGAARAATRSQRGFVPQS